MFVTRRFHESYVADLRAALEVARTEAREARYNARDERLRYDTLLAEVLRRGLKDERRLAPDPEPEKPLPDVILRALGQWPEGSQVYQSNLAYAHAQWSVRPEDAEGIAEEIKRGEDIEAWT